MIDNQYDIPVINQAGQNYSPIVRDPDTTNPMLDTHFKLTFTRIPNVSFWCTSTNIPSISIGEVAVPNKFVSLHVPGSSIQFDQLRVSFLIDEEFTNWNEIYNWMQSVVPFEDFRRILPNDANYDSDATIHCLNSAKQPHVNFIFKKLFPISLGEIGRAHV